MMGAVGTLTAGLDWWQARVVAALVPLLTRDGTRAPRTYRDEMHHLRNVIAREEAVLVASRARWPHVDFDAAQRKQHRRRAWLAVLEAKHAKGGSKAWWDE